MNRVSARMAKFAFRTATRPAAWLMRLLNRAVTVNTGEHHFHPMEQFPWRDEVDALYPAIRAEVDQMLEASQSVPRVTDFLPVGDMYYPENEWRQIMFYFIGNKIEDTCAMYPNTAAALARVPGLSTGSLSFLAAHEGFPSHTHYYKGFLIYHLGIVVPSGGGGCEIRVGDEMHPWGEGESFVIDPVFEHEGWNRTDGKRVVLLAEFARPDIPVVLQPLNNFYLWIFNNSPFGKKMLQKIRAVSALHCHDMALREESIVAPATLR